MACIFLNEVYPPLGVGECVDTLVIEAALVPICDDDDTLYIILTPKGYSYSYLLGLPSAAVELIIVQHVYSSTVCKVCMYVCM